MLIFKYQISPAQITPPGNGPIFEIIVTDAEKNNTTTTFHDKKYQHTLPKEDLEKIKEIIKNTPELFDIPESLEPNDVLDGSEYSFTFSDGEKTNSFSGFNILDYGRKPRKNATLALRTARTIKDKVLFRHDIRTMIPNRLQHWPKYRPSTDNIKI